MQTTTSFRPQPNEFGSYYLTYISKVPDGDILQTLAAAKNSTLTFLKNLPEEKWSHRYASGKWSIKELVQHLLDAERIFAYRALRVARQDRTPLPGFDENAFAPASQADLRTPASLIAEYEAVREATIQLFKNLPEDAWKQIGIASENPVSPLAAAWIIAGHEIHHLAVMRERYL